MKYLGLKVTLLKDVGSIPKGSVGFIYLERGDYVYVDFPAAGEQYVVLFSNLTMVHKVEVLGCPPPVRFWIGRRVFAHRTIQARGESLEIIDPGHGTFEVVDVLATVHGSLKLRLPSGQTEWFAADAFVLVPEGVFPRQNLPSRPETAPETGAVPDRKPLRHALVGEQPDLTAEPRLLPAWLSGALYRAQLCPLCGQNSCTHPRPDAPKSGVITVPGRVKLNHWDPEND